MSSPLLTTKSLAIGYPTAQRVRTVAHQLCLEVPTGELLCLLGPNGSGKSTLLRTLAGMQAPLSGTIQLDGKPLASLTASLRATQLAVVLTELPDAHLTVADLVTMGRYPYTGWLGRLSEHDRRIVVHALEVTDTRTWADRPVGTLSDGERQKVMIARAVAQDTPLLILDEPTAHLDLLNRTTVLRLLHRLAREQRKAVLLSTHALDLALLMADQLWLMREGNVHVGVPEDLALDGTLAKTFAHQDIVFNEQTGTFRVARPTGRPIRVEGPAPVAFWTRRALERAGYTVVEHSTDAPTVQAVVEHGTPRWRIVKQDDSTEEVPTIAALLNRLRNA